MNGFKKIKRTVIILLYLMMVAISISVIGIVIWINIKNRLN